MKTEKINYKFVPVPLKLMLLLDDKCTKVLTHLIQLHFAFADENDMYFRSIDLLSEETQLSKRVLNAVLVTLNNLYIVDIYSVGQSKGKKTNQFRINFNIIEIYDSIEFDTILSLNKIQTLNYSDKGFKVEYHNLQNLITKSDNSSDNNLQNLITKSVLEEKLKAYSQNLITKSAKINHNINNTYKNNIGPNIGPNNNIIYISEQLEEKEKSNSKVNCFLSKEELEKYNLVGLSEAESNSIAESETGKVKSNNKLDNSNIDNNTANAVTEETVYSNIDNLENKSERNNISTIVESNTANAESGNNKLDNLNEVNTAVLSPSDSSNEESVISTKKMSENGLKQVKTRELGIVNKTDNSNSVNSNTANAESGSKELNNSNESNLNKLEGNKETVNSNSVIPYNKLDNSNNVIHKEKELEENKIDNLNSVRSKEEGIEGENKTDNSNEGIDNTIAEGDNSNAYAVSEFRNKCTNYTIIIEGKETEIDQPIEEYIRCYYNRIMNTIYNTSEFYKQRKIFNRMLKDNNLNGQHYDEMSDKLDVRYSRYVELDKESKSNEQTDKEDFSQEDLQIIANELLNQCLNFKLTKENNMQDFYRLRAQYSGFVELYDLKKEGLKLQEKFAELSAANKALNSPSFAN